MDILAYALAIKKASEYTNQMVQSLGTGFNYQGSVATESALPDDPTLGDLYTVDETYSSCVWDGTKWFQISYNPPTTLLSVDI